MFNAYNFGRQIAPHLQILVSSEFRDEGAQLWTGEKESTQGVRNLSGHLSVDYSTHCKTEPSRERKVARTLEGAENRSSKADELSYETNVQHSSTFLYSLNSRHDFALGYRETQTRNMGSTLHAHTSFSLLRCSTTASARSPSVHFSRVLHKESMYWLLARYVPTCSPIN